MPSSTSRPWTEPFLSPGETSIAQWGHVGVPELLKQNTRFTWSHNIETPAVLGQMKVLFEKPHKGVIVICKCAWAAGYKPLIIQAQNDRFIERLTW